MRRALLRAAAALTLAPALIAVACGGSGTGAPSPTAPPPAAASATPPAPPPARTTPQVQGGVYRFPSKGYAITPPVGWLSQPDNIFDQVNSVFPSDVFYATARTAGIQSNISITCQKPRPDQATTDAYRDARGALLHQLAGAAVTPRPVTVAGQPAWAFDYTQALPGAATPGAGPNAVDKTDVVFVARACRWLITLAAPRGERATLAPLFDQSLASMQLFAVAATTTPGGN